MNTFTEGYGGRFGDIGGGIVLAPYLGWVSEITGLAVPEPSVGWLLLLGLTFLAARRSKSGAGRAGRRVGAPGQRHQDRAAL